MKKNALLIVNPNSGTRSKERLSDLLLTALRPHNYDLRIHVTTGPGEAHSLIKSIREQKENVDLVVVAGGDGTVNEVADSLSDTEIPMGIIPCGSGNGLARTLGIPQDFRQAVEIIAEQNMLHIDCGVVNSRRFFCTFGMGFDAAVTEKYSAEKRRGRLSYVKSAFLEFLNYSPNVYGLSLDGKVITERAMVVAVCNASQYGNNAYIAPEASLTDGLLDVTVIHDGSLFQQALAGIQLISGKLNKNILVDTFRVSHVNISRLDNSAAHIDGELFNPGKVAEVSIHPKCLKVIYGKNPDRPFRPIMDPFRSFLQDMGSDIKQAFR